jgi:hypothetical protein
MSLNVNEVRNGRIYSVVFAGPVKMLKGGRMGVVPNPLLDLDVTKRMVLAVQACSRDSYKRRQLKANPDWQPSDKPSGFAPTEHPCIDMNVNTGEPALRGWACGVRKYEVYVGGQPATAEQLAIIEAYKPASSGEYNFMRLPLAKVEHEGWDDSEAE